MIKEQGKIKGAVNTAISPVLKASKAVGNLANKISFGSLKVIQDLIDKEVHSSFANQLLEYSHLQHKPWQIGLNPQFPF